MAIEKTYYQILGVTPHAEDIVLGDICILKMFVVASS